MHRQRNFLLTLFISIIIFLFFIIALANDHSEQNRPDIFSEKEIIVRTSETVGRLFVTHANAIVSGQITKGIFIIQGNLLIKKTANIEGFILVIGGEISVEQGARLHNSVWVLPLSFLDIHIGLWSLFIAGVLVLPFIPLGLSLIKTFRYSSLYARLKPTVFTILQRWPTLYIFAAFLTSGLLLASFAELTNETLLQHEMDFFDNVIIWLVRYYANPGLDSLMLRITALGSAQFYGVLSALLLLGLILFRKRREASALGICLLGGASLNSLLKNLFERARPDMFNVISEAGYSFPSGHAMVSLCFYGMLAYLISQKIPSWAWRMVLLIFTGLFVLAIGISRIYLGVHYPSDVLAGYAAGATWLFFCISLLMWWEHKQKLP